jgi:hypothetical protein
MARKIFIIAILVMSHVVVAATGENYNVYGDVFNQAGTAGDNTTANSFAGLTAYRMGVNGEAGSQFNNPINSGCPEKIYDAAGGDPAYFASDVGSHAWTSVPYVGQEIVAIVQVYKGQFPSCEWSGGSFTGADEAVISASDAFNSLTDMPAITLNPLPTVMVSAVNSGSVILAWTGISSDPHDLVTGYTVYRSTESSGIGGYKPLTWTAQQVKAGQVSFTDSTLDLVHTYYYRIAVNYIWGGGNGAPDYFVTDARSDSSAGVYCGPSPTATPTSTYIVESATITATNTATATETITQTVTPTTTPTQTATFTLTITPTVTPTASPSVTMTATLTATPSATDTPTLTATTTLTPYQTSTKTPVISAAAIEKNRVIVFNNPVKDGRVKAGFYSENEANGQVRFYSVTGELVKQVRIKAAAGPNIFEVDFSRYASGLYIMRINLGGKELPDRKIAVVQ